MLLKVSNLDVFYGDLQVLFNVSLNVKEGEFVGLLGPNGAGKSTLAKTICGLVKPKRGSITFKGQDVTNHEAHEIVQLGLRFLPEGARVFPWLTVEENLRVGAYLSWNDFKDRVRLIYELFPILEERKNQLAGTLSGGERKMLSIAQALMTEPEMIIFDEPSLGLAPKIVSKIFEVANKLNKEEKITILMIEQHVTKVLELADRVYLLENGRITEPRRSPKELLTDPYIREKYLGL